MRPIVKAETLQIEWTTKCPLSCANCTHFSGSYYRPPELTFDRFKEIVDSLEGYPSMIGAIGGDPLVHPQFEEFCRYALTKIPREKHGLWTTFPKGKEKYREAICETFGYVFLNDHTRDDIPHAPILVASEEYFKDKADLYIAADACWLGNQWSPCANTKGAFFCEVAASMSQLFQGEQGWKIEPGWWKRTPKDYAAQIEEWCSKCGCCMPLVRRKSVENTDDISPGNLERLKGKSRKVDKGLVQVSDFKMDPQLLNDMYPKQTYKDLEYRQGIAARYGIFLTLTRQGYLEPHLNPKWKSGDIPESRPTLFQQYCDKYKETKPC